MFPERFLHVLRLSIKSIGVHGLRSALTVLGIVLGVVTVILLLSLAEGASDKAIKQIEELGATNIIVKSVKPMDDGKENRGQERLSYGLTTRDMERIVATIPSVASVTPLREFRKDIRHLDRKLEGRVVSVMPNYLGMNSLRMNRGRFIEDLDNERFANVVVLGGETAEILFPIGDPLGRSVQVGEKHHYRVVGVTERRNPSAGIGGSLGSQDYNRDVYIPFATDQVRFGKTLVTWKPGNFQAETLEISQITIAVDRRQNVKKTAEIVQGLLEQYHTKKDTAITVPLEILDKAEQTQQLLTVLLFFIASISLIVGGIGIMNIMLATVTERTREIGVRRALGAKRRDIAMQFLAETVVLSGAGGLLGVGLGIGAAHALAFFFDVPTIVQPWSPLVAFGVSVVVGLTFGIYPAMRAAAMDPIEALRHE